MSKTVYSVVAALRAKCASNVFAQPLPYIAAGLNTASGHNVNPRISNRRKLHRTDRMTQISKWLLCVAYAMLSGGVIAIISVISTAAGAESRISFPVALVLSALCPLPIAFLRGLHRWTVIGYSALVLAIELPTVNVAVSCWWQHGCGSTVVEATVVGFLFLYPLVTLPATFFLWSILRRKPR
ncbi:MAG TPA: hypothetical protein VGD01_18280 [Candidatus Elarobacter sp.]|jgi:hypothetical protein